MLLLLLLIAPGTADRDIGMSASRLLFLFSYLIFFYIIIMLSFFFPCCSCCCPPLCVAAVRQ